MQKLYKFNQTIGMQEQTITRHYKKNIVLTGGNNGIGYQTAKALYSEGHSIIFGSRNKTKNQEAVNQIKAAFPQSKGKIEGINLDLSVRSSVQQFAAYVKKQFKNIDILVNNAGLIHRQPKVGELNYQMTFSINHFGHFFLTYLLFDLIAKSKQGRIINLGSYAHYGAKDDIFKDIQLKHPQDYSAWDIYCNSKFANALFTIGLNDRLKNYQNVKTVVVHPGAVETGFGSDSGLVKFFKICLCCIFVNQQQGARASLSLCRAPFQELKSGQYYNDDGRHEEMDKRARNKQLSQRLWKLSEQAYKIKFKI